MEASKRKPRRQVDKKKRGLKSRSIPRPIPRTLPSEIPWAGCKDALWTPRHTVVVQPAEQEALLSSFAARDQLEDCQLASVEAIPWQIHSVAWEPASGHRYVLLESIGYGNRGSQGESPKGGANWLRVEMDPEEAGFDPFLLMMMNSYRLMMQKWLITAPLPHNLFWHNPFAPADIEVLATLLRVYQHRSSDGSLIVYCPGQPRDWKEMQQQNSLCAEIQGFITEDWIKASMTALDIAKELDTLLLARRKNCTHSLANLRVLKGLKDEAESKKQLAMAGKDLRKFLEGLLPPKLLSTPFTLADFASQGFIDHMKLLRGKLPSETFDFSG